QLAVGQASSDVVVEAGLPLGGEQRALACAVAALDEGLHLGPERVVAQDLRGIHEGGVVAGRKRAAELGALAAGLRLCLQPLREESRRRAPHVAAAARASAG